MKVGAVRCSWQGIRLVFQTAAAKHFSGGSSSEPRRQLSSFWGDRRFSSGAAWARPSGAGRTRFSLNRRRATTRVRQCTGRRKKKEKKKILMTLGLPGKSRRPVYQGGETVQSLQPTRLFSPARRYLRVQKAYWEFRRVHKIIRRMEKNSVCPGGKSGSGSRTISNIVPQNIFSRDGTRRLGVYRCRPVKKTTVCQVFDGNASNETLSGKPHGNGPGARYLWGR